MARAAKTGTGGHLPGEKVNEQIAEVRGLKVGETAVSPARFPDWTRLDQYRDFAAEVRERTGGIPVGFKLSAQHIEKDIDAALEIGVDYIILDGRGGGTGSAPLIFRDNISVPTIPALARARRHLDRSDAQGCHTDHYRRAAHPGRLRQGPGAGRRRYRSGQRGDPGHWLPRHARLPHQQLPGGHRHAEAGAAGAACRWISRRSAWRAFLAPPSS